MTRFWVALAIVAALAAVCEAIPRSVERRLAQTKGQPEYARSCGSCHGPRGSGGEAPALVPLTLDLSELIAIVRQGIGVMRGIPRDRVSDEEISAIRDYLVSVEK